MSTYLSAELRARLIDADNGQCAYCQTREDTTGQALTTDHIIPSAQNGTTTFQNLCRACRHCNESKWDHVGGIDPLTDETVNLYHPRQQNWDEHFFWDQSGTRILGLTATGRATVIALDMNNGLIVYARRRWVSAGWHPPLS